MNSIDLLLLHLCREQNLFNIYLIEIKSRIEQCLWCPLGTNLHSLQVTILLHFLQSIDWPQASFYSLVYLFLGQFDCRISLDLGLFGPLSVVLHSFLLFLHGLLVVIIVFTFFFYLTKSIVILLCWLIIIFSLSPLFFFSEMFTIQFWITNNIDAGNIV